MSLIPSAPFADITDRFFKQKERKKVYRIRSGRNSSLLPSLSSVEERTSKDHGRERLLPLRVPRIRPRDVRRGCGGRLASSRNDYGNGVSASAASASGCRCPAKDVDVAESSRAILLWRRERRGRTSAQ